MLCLVLTPQKLFAGVKTESTQLIPFQNQPFIPFGQAGIRETLQTRLPEISDQYQKLIQQHPDLQQGDHIPTTVAVPPGLSAGEQDAIRSIFQQDEQHKLLLMDNYAVAYIYGLQKEQKNCLVLDCLDDYLNLCYYIDQKGGEVVEVPSVGPLAGQKYVLDEIKTRFQKLGLGIGTDSDAQFMQQIQAQAGDETYSYSLTREFGNLEAEIQLPFNDYLQHLGMTRQELPKFINADLVNQKNLNHIMLLGNYMNHQDLVGYLDKDLQLGQYLIRQDQSSEWDAFHKMIEGMNMRGQMILEEERKRREAEKRARIEAKRQAKIARETLLAEIQAACVDADKEEEYQTTYLAKGKDLGIPEAVILWNIEEAITNNELIQLGEPEAEGKAKDEVAAVVKEESKPAPKAVVEEKVEEKKEEEKPPAPKAEKAPVPEKEVPSEEIDPPVKAVSPVEAKTPEKVEEKEPAKPVQKKEVTAKEVEKVSPKEPVKPTEEPVVAEKPVEPAKPQIQVPVKQNGHQNGNGHGKSEKPKEEKKEPVLAKVAEKVAEPVAAPVQTTVSNPKTTAEPKVKMVHTGLNDLMSLSDIFDIKANLAGESFPSKKVNLKGEADLKVVRVLAREEFGDGEKVAAFQKLYKKEISYYEDMSQISEAKEGKYFYREFIERQTLGNHMKKAGMLDKKKVDDLSSNDLKFILHIFQAVKELPVTYTGLNKDTVLVVSKRKWNLQKNQSIRFIGFTPEDCSQEEMIEQTHRMFEDLFGDKFYKEFRNKFQL
ncbi:MAG: hypothetical protein AAF206_04075 [Bacteroidota bacterium]